MVRFLFKIINSVAMQDSLVCSSKLNSYSLKWIKDDCDHDDKPVILLCCALLIIFAVGALNDAYAFPSFSIPSLTNYYS